MDKQKIEEMAQCKNGYGFICCDCVYRKGCERYSLAEHLYNAGYRKLDDNAIKALRKAKGLEEKIRKETAEKFAERLKEMAYQSTDWSHGEHPMVVEVDYIDEICEELTEGK